VAIQRLLYLLPAVGVVLLEKGLGLLKSLRVEHHRAQLRVATHRFHEGVALRDAHGEDRLIGQALPARSHFLCGCADGKAGKGDEER